MRATAAFALVLLAGIALVILGGVHLDDKGEVIVCVTTPCPEQDDPVWPELALAGGIGLLGVSAYLAIRSR